MDEARPPTLNGRGQARALPRRDSRWRLLGVQALRAPFRAHAGRGAYHGCSHRGGRRPSGPACRARFRALPRDRVRLPFHRRCLAPRRRGPHPAQRALEADARLRWPQLLAHLHRHRRRAPPRPPGQRPRHAPGTGAGGRPRVPRSLRGAGGAWEASALGVEEGGRRRGILLGPRAAARAVRLLAESASSLPVFECGHARQPKLLHEGVHVPKP
mmetsp:Transcript_120812/g.385715  ORF Transcript_120812/g.385715 Transcript_120812/m.385715 type:complete len:214 (+) Transcript_120812:2058-2699(+)